MSLRVRVREREGKRERERERERGREQTITGEGEREGDQREHGRERERERERENGQQQLKQVHSHVASKLAEQRRPRPNMAPTADTANAELPHRRLWSIIVHLALPTPRAMTWTRCTDALTYVGLFAVRVADGLT